MDKIRILNDLKNNLILYLKENLTDVILFGSQIEENVNPNSDYDILILVKKELDWKSSRIVSNICYDIDLKYGILTDTHILCEMDLQKHRGKQPIFETAIKNGIRA